MLPGGFGWSILSTSSDSPRTSESKMNSCRVSANLADVGEKSDSTHPFRCAEARFASKVVQMGYQSLNDLFESYIGILAIDAVDVVSDVFDCEILEDRCRYVWWIHSDGGGIIFAYKIGLLERVAGYFVTLV